MSWERTIVTGVLRNGTRVGVRSPTLVVMVIPPADLESGRVEALRRIVAEVVVPLAQLVGEQRAKQMAAKRYVIRRRGAGKPGHHKVMAEATSPMITMELAEVNEPIRKVLEGEAEIAGARATAKGSA